MVVGKKKDQVVGRKEDPKVERKEGRVVERNEDPKVDPLSARTQEEASRDHHYLEEMDQSS